VFIYFIGAEGKRNTLIKIGKANDPLNRLMELQTGSPIRLRIIGSVKCRNSDHARQVEKLAHNLFWKQRRHGEWFNLRRSQINQIQSLINEAAARCADP
jgi:hypothetical protein